jgi:AraC-like DNA-binding protein
MSLLNSIPLIGVALGIFMLLFIIPNRKNLVQNRLAKLFLIAIILLNTISQLDAFLYFNAIISIDASNTSYVFYHLYGLLFYFYVLALLKDRKKIIRWGIIAGVYTLLRTAILLWAAYSITDFDSSELSIPIVVIGIDGVLSLLLNIGFLLAAYKLLHKIDFSVRLSSENANNIMWLKRMLLASIVTYVAILQYDIIAEFQGVPWDNQDKVESLFINLLFYVIAFLAIRFPIFSIYGDYNEDSSSEGKKYIKSSLKEDDSDILWQKINQLMQEGKPYSNPEYRLNDLARNLDNSVHHTSQVINEKGKCSFSDFINRFRIEDAKELLINEKSQQFTILAIAYEVGFNSKTTFYAAFKKECGVTPSLFKKENL